MKRIYREDLLTAFEEYNNNMGFNARGKWRLPSSHLGLYKATEKHGLLAVRKGAFKSYYEWDELLPFVKELVEEKPQVDEKKLVKYLNKYSKK